MNAMCLAPTVLAARQLDMSWDRKVRGKGRINIRAAQVLGTHVDCDIPWISPSLVARYPLY